MKKQNTKNTISRGFVVAGLLLASPAVANESSSSDGGGLNAGDWLVGFSGSYNYLSDGGESANLFTANVNASYFFKDDLSVGLNTFGVFVPSGGDVEDSGYAIGLEPNLRYYFSSNSLYRPYVGVHGGFAYLDLGDESETVGTYGLHLGMLVPIGETSYFNAQLKWTEFEASDDADVDLSAVQVLLGLQVKF